MPVVKEAHVPERSRGPPLHAGSCDRNPVDTADTIRQVTTDGFEALLSKKLTATGDVTMSLAAVLCRTIAVFCEDRARYAKVLLSSEFIQYVLTIPLVE